MAGGGRRQKAWNQGELGLLKQENGASEAGGEI